MKTMRVYRDEKPMPSRKEVKPTLKTLLSQATTNEEKRNLITQTNPNYYAFGITLTPTNPYQGEEDENN
jgi:hypothetical protein